MGSSVPVAVGRTERFESIRPRVVELFGTADDTIERVARVFELMELAWHDAYGEPAPQQNVVDDVLTCSRGTLAGLVDAAHLAVIDSRDLAVAASRLEQPCPETTEPGSNTEPGSVSRVDRRR